MGEMMQIAAECVKHPRRKSVWSEALERYVSEGDPAYPRAGSKAGKQREGSAGISPLFKLIFLTAAGGTALFIVTCVGIHVWTAGEMPTATEKLVDGMFDLAKIGFGAVVGLLGGQKLQGS